MGKGRRFTLDASFGARAARLGPRAGLLGLLAANLISVAGGAVSLVALPWFVLATTGSTAATGLATVCETVPLVAVALVAGAVVHRLGALATRIGSDVISAATVLAIPALQAGIGITYWQLLVLVAVNGAVRAPAPAASLVLLGWLSAQGGASADRARSSYTGSVQLAAALSAPVSGLLISARGAPTALVVDAASFAVSAIILAATLRVQRPLEYSRAPHDDRPQRVWVGLEVLCRDRLLRSMCAVALASAVLGGAWSGVLAPAYGQRVLHSPTALGMLLGVFGLGALTGNLFYPDVTARINTYRLMWICLGISTALLYGVLSVSPVLAVLTTTVALAGLASGILAPLWLRLLSERSDPHLHGHVFGVSFALEQGGIALGALSCGLLLTRVSIPAALNTMACIGLALTLFAATAPSLRALRHDKATFPSPVSR